MEQLKRAMSHEAQKEIERISREDVKRAVAFRDMVRTPGWAYYEALLNEYINARMNVLIGPTPDDRRGEGEHTKGTVFGLILARDCVRSTIAAVGSVVGDGDDEEKRPASEETKLRPSLKNGSELR